MATLSNTDDVRESPDPPRECELSRVRAFTEACQAAAAAAGAVGAIAAAVGAVAGAVIVLGHIL
jgi:hypothetical protein